MFGSEVLHLPTDLEDDITLGHTCQFVERRLSQFVTGLADGEVVLGMLLLDILECLLEALERELALSHEVVDLSDGEFESHIFLEGLLVVGHFDLVAHVLYLIEVAVLNTPNIGRDDHQFGFLDLCGGRERSDSHQQGKDISFHWKFKIKN